jgi:hypothetical protein
MVYWCKDVSWFLSDSYLLNSLEKDSHLHCENAQKYEKESRIKFRLRREALPVIASNTFGVSIN